MSSWFRVGEFKDLLKLENDILRRENEMSAEEAHKWYDDLVSYQIKFSNLTLTYWNDRRSDCMENYHRKDLDIVDYIERKISKLQKHVKRFFKPANESASSIELKVNDDQNNVNNQTHTVNLSALLKKQKFYIQMIDSLAPEGEISSKEAKLQYEHLSSFYEKFISNQSEITTFVTDDAFNDQMNISKEVHRKVLSLQETLKEIFSPTKPAVLPESKVNEHFNRTDRSNVIVDFLDSQYKKQKSLIEQIELIESKNDPSAAEAEILYNHVSQLHESFIKNQATIETYVKGPVLDIELEKSREIRVKVITIETKLKEIFDQVESPSLVESKSVDGSKQMKEKDKVIYLNSLLERQKSLIEEIESMSFDKQVQKFEGNYSSHELTVVSLSQLLSDLEKWFFVNQTKIGELIGDDFDIYKQDKISSKIQQRLTNIQKEYASYVTWMTQIF